MEISHYDPATRRVNLTPDASLYVRLHEEAHKIQHETQCLPWIAYVHCNGIRILGYLSRIWVEFDAMRRARNVMKQIGCWNVAASNEASTAFKTYIRRRS